MIFLSSELKIDRKKILQIQNFNFDKNIWRKRSNRDLYTMYTVLSALSSVTCI